MTERCAGGVIEGNLVCLAVVSSIGAFKAQRSFDVFFVFLLNGQF